MNEYQKAKNIAMGGFASTQAIGTLEEKLNEILERLKTLEETVAYLQRDTDKTLPV